MTGNPFRLRYVFALVLAVAVSMTMLMRTALTQAEDAGAAAARAELAAAVDAGPPDASPSIPAASLPDPVAHPADALGVVEQARKDGSIWLALSLALIMIGKAYVRRLEPTPGTAIDGWRAKSVVLVGASLPALAAVADRLTGAGAWGAVAVAGLGFLLAVVDAFNPPKGSAKTEPAS